MPRAGRVRSALLPVPGLQAHAGEPAGTEATFSVGVFDAPLWFTQRSFLIQRPGAFLESPFLYRGAFFSRGASLF